MKTFRQDIQLSGTIPPELATSAMRTVIADETAKAAHKNAKRFFGIYGMQDAIDIASASFIRRGEKSQCEHALKAELIDVKARTDFNDIAILDAKMLYVIASKVELEDVAEDFRSVILEGLKHMQRPQIAQMTYEDIILNNPAQDMRTFTVGRTAMSEACFYRGHQVIEGHIHGVIDALKQAHKTGDISYLDEAHESATQAAKVMRLFGSELNRGHFNTFKPYFDTNPYTGEKGPSGVFTATIPHIDVLLDGAENYEGHDYLRENASYFPQRDLSDLNTSIAQGINLSERFTGHAVAIDKLEAITLRMATFRKMHEGAVRKHIGDDVVGSAEGGSAVPFLHERIAATLRKVQSISKKKDKHDGNIPAL